MEGAWFILAPANGTFRSKVKLRFLSKETFPPIIQFYPRIGTKYSTISRDRILSFLSYSFVMLDIALNNIRKMTWELRLFGSF